MNRTHLQKTLESEWNLYSNLVSSWFLLVLCECIYSNWPIKYMMSICFIYIYIYWIVFSTPIKKTKKKTIPNIGCIIWFLLSFLLVIVSIYWLLVLGPIGTCTLRILWTQVPQSSIDSGERLLSLATKKNWPSNIAGKEWLSMDCVFQQKSWGTKFKNSFRSSPKKYRKWANHRARISQSWLVTEVYPKKHPFFDGSDVPQELTT